MVSFIQQPDNPFGLLPEVANSSPTFVDIDADGDLDAFVGAYGGDVRFYRNTGTATNPKFAAPLINQFGLNNVGQYSTPTFADINGDGKLDAFVGNQDGDIVFFKNIGTASFPIFVPPSVIAPNPFGLRITGTSSHPTFADIDADGDLDAFVGDFSGNTNFFRNTGSPTNPNFFGTLQANPFGLSRVGLNSSPAFADIDNDGDLDAFIGDRNGNTNFFQNTGSASSPMFAAPQTNPFGLVKVGGSSAPTFADINGDGKLDVFIGEGNGAGLGNGDINFFLNTTVSTLPPLFGAGDQKQFAIAPGNGTVVVIGFGGVGQGVNPKAAVIAEVDTLQFTGADLTPEKLLLTQQGDDLEVSFEGVADTKVVLGNFALEDLDNLTKATGAAVRLGNILFDSQSQIADSFDVFNADWQREQVFNSNSVTFLNDLNNTTQGFNNSDDVINAQGGNDRIWGRSGDDLLRGGDGRDKLIGGKGDDILVGGQGDDLLRGGRGKDTFVLVANAGTDTVKDFQNGKDHFGLAGGLAFGQLTISQSNSNTLISITNGGEVLASLMGVNANLIEAGDFTVSDLGQDYRYFVDTGEVSVLSRGWR